MKIQGRHWLSIFLLGLAAALLLAILTTSCAPLPDRAVSSPGQYIRHDLDEAERAIVGEYRGAGYRAGHDVHTLGLIIESGFTKGREK